LAHTVEEFDRRDGYYRDPVTRADVQKAAVGMALLAEAWTRSR
jgi:hypothetical protein